MIVQTVSSGQPITATWANSLVGVVNTPSITCLTSHPNYRKCNRGIRDAQNDASFHVRLAYGVYTLNTGQIYMNGLLVQPQKKEGEEQGTSENSYNMFSSISGWTENYYHVIATEGKTPYWYITIEAPTHVTKANISEVKATLIKNTTEEAPTAPENLEEGKTWLCIQLNTFEEVGEEDNKTYLLKQLVSGTIYLNEAIPSIVAGDGIKITEIEDNVLEISSNPEVIANVDVDVRAGENVKVVKSVDNTTRVFTVHANVPTVSLLAGDGIQVDASQHGDVTAYTISNTYSPIPYDFDEEWFIVSDGVVTFNTEKLVQLAEEIAANTTVNVNVTGIVDEVKTGSVQVNTTGITNGEATTNVRIV
jgi:hypothetical protein